MSQPLSIQFDNASFYAFQKQMSRFGAMLGNSPEDAVRYGTIALCQAMQTRTRKAPAKRKVRISQTARRKRLKNGDRIFVAEVLNRDTGGIRNALIFAPDIATAKLSPKAAITKSGLAKASWGWAMHKLFQEPAPAAALLASPVGALEVSRSSSAVGVSRADINNKLDYISKAFNGARGPTVESAMAAAAGKMKGRISYAIRQAKKEAGFQ